MSWQIRVLEETGAPLDGGPEAVANSVDPYVQGWMDSITETNPELLPEMGVRVSDILCNQTPSAAEEIMFARVLMHAGPRMDTMRAGLDCVLRRQQDEDVVLWTTLEAWRRAELAPSPDWEAWRSRATDERTTRRFLPAGVGRPGPERGI